MLTLLSKEGRGKITPTLDMRKPETKEVKSWVVSQELPTVCGAELLSGTQGSFLQDTSCLRSSWQQLCSEGPAHRQHE